MSHALAGSEVQGFGTSIKIFWNRVARGFGVLEIDVGVCVVSLVH